MQRNRLISLNIFILSFLMLFASTIPAQNTVGVLNYNAEASLGGYNLIYPQLQSTVYLLDACGQIVHRWEDEDAGARPGAVAYLLPDARLLRAKTYVPLFEEPTFGSGGSGGVIELVSWDNEVLWTYVVANSRERQHHDVHYMPNGHVLILAYELIDRNEMIANGFDTISYSLENIWSEKIIEVDPLTDSIHWEWHLWDHLVQDFDSLAANFGVISDHSERIDLNYQDFAETRPDWVHVNALDYNPDLDQIMLSARNFNEIWIIDHSTNTTEAAGSSGGNSNRGGDLLWRWGSPHAYQQATLEEEKLFAQHDAQWVDDFVSEDDPYYGQIAVFNNFINFSVEESLSRGEIIEPSWNAATQSYEQSNGVFLPDDFSASFVHPDTAANFSSNASSIQIMADGHVLMCAARQGRSFELDETGALVWEYLTPLRFGQPFPQGSDLGLGDNFTFQMERYPADYTAFAGRDLSPQGYIELNPNEEFCDLVNGDEVLPKEPRFQVFPNPASGYVQVDCEPQMLPLHFSIYNLFGQKMRDVEVEYAPFLIDISHFPAGTYLLLDQQKRNVQRLVKMK